MNIHRIINERGNVDRYSRRDLTARHAKRIRKGQPSGYSGPISAATILRWNEQALTARRIANGQPVQLRYQNG